MFRTREAKKNINKKKKCGNGNQENIPPEDRNGNEFDMEDPNKMDTTELKRTT